MLTNANQACFWLRVWWKTQTWFIGLEFPHFPSFSYPNAECYEGFGENYQGDQSRTRSNLPCAPWRDHHSRLARCVPATFWPYNFANLCHDVQNRHAPLCQTADEHLSLKQRLRSPQFSAMSSGKTTRRNWTENMQTSRISFFCKLVHDSISLLWNVFVFL